MGARGIEPLSVALQASVLIQNTKHPKLVCFDKRLLLRHLPPIISEDDKPAKRPHSGAVRIEPQSWVAYSCFLPFTLSAVTGNLNPIEYLSAPSLIRHWTGWLSVAQTPLTSLRDPNPVATPGDHLRQIVCCREGGRIVHLQAICLIGGLVRID